MTLNILGWLLLAWAAAAVPATPPLVQSNDCGDRMALHELGLPEETTGSNPSGELALFACEGGLHLVAASSGEVLIRINPGWWFDQLEDSVWDTATGELVVEASFITGIGPTGTVPFRVTYRVGQDENGVWQSREVTPEAAQFTVEADGMVEINNADQLTALDLRSRGQPYTVNVDFEQDRLIVMPVWLTSGSIVITDVHVHHTRRAYFVTYDVETPEIGTTDMKRSLIYLVLPRDIRYVSFEDPEFGARRVDARTGIIDRGSFAGAPGL